MAEPGVALAASRALFKGFCYKAYYRLRGRRFRAGRNFRVFGRLRLRGPGEVVFGNDVVINDLVTPWTYSPQARIVVGDHVILGGTMFGCVQEIRIGRDSLVGASSIMDTDFHSTRADRRSEHAPVRVAPVFIGDNVWIGKQAGILPGTRIGENSVVSFGAVCMREYPDNVVIMGNPAKVAMPVQHAPLPESVLEPLTGAAPFERSTAAGPVVAGGLSLALLTLLLPIMTMSPVSAPAAQTKIDSRLGSVPEHRWHRLASRTVFFAHQSVGADLLAGVGEIVSRNPQIPLRVSRAEGPGTVSGPGFFEATVGQNGDPGSKATAFASYLAAGLGDTRAVAMYKHCYLDVDADTDVAAMFEAYRANHRALRKRYPEVVLVHFTIPLTTDEGLARTLVKRALGRTGGRMLNAKRNRFNALLRREYAGKEPIFDLARFESTGPDGERAFFDQAGQRVFALSPAWTSDGGHLNQAGRRVIAEELLLFLAAL